MSISATATEVFIAEAIPNTSASQPSLTKNSNPLNTPPSTGAITVPNSPKGTSDTAHGFTTSYDYVNNTSNTQAMMKSLNTLNGWNGVRVPQNPV